MQKINSYCAICGTGYHVCMSCQDNRRLNPWKIYTDTSEHYKIFQIIHGVNAGIFTVEEARKKLKNIDLSDIDTYKEDVKKQINKILNTKPKKVSSKSKINNESSE